MNSKTTEKITGILTLAAVILTIVAIIMIILLGVRGFKTNEPEGNEKGTGDKQESENTETDHTSTPVSSTTLGSTPDYGQTYIDSIVFLGDSTTAHMRSRGVLKDGKDTKQVWSGENNTLNLDYNIDTTTIIYPETGEKVTIGKAAELKKPEYMVITMGINNGVAYCDETKFKAYYQKIIDAIKSSSPDTKIMLQSIFPVTKQKQEETPSIANSRIDNANEWVKQIAEQNNLRYLDTASILKDSSGNLKSEYDNGDGLHMTASGYQALLDYIRTHGYK